LRHQHGVGARRGLPRHVHASRLHVRRDGPLPRQERRTHVRHEPDDLPARLSRLLGVRVRDRVGELVQRPGRAGVVLFARAAVDAAGNATGAYTYGLLGTKGFFLTDVVGDVSVLALFFFMMVFMDTTATIPTGAMAERWSWKNFCLFGLWVALPYCMYANWV